MRKPWGLAFFDPKDGVAFNNRGLDWHEKKQCDKAIADYNEAIRLDPKDVRAFINRGWAWENKREDDEAEADYGKTRAGESRLALMVSAR